MTDETTTETEAEVTEKPKRATRTAAPKEEPKNIFQLISTISEEAGALAPVKTGGVQFPFRGIDGTVNHLSPYLRKHGVVVVPTVLDSNVTFREINPTKVITQTEVRTQFTFYAPDATSVSVTTVGLAQDYSDRSSAQAQSVAFRVALLQLFTLPTQSTEPEQAGEDNKAYIEKAVAETKAPAAAKKPAAPTVDIDSVKAEIGALLAERDITEPEDIKAYGNKFHKNRPGWATALPALQKLRDHLKAGEVLDD